MATARSQIHALVSQKNYPCVAAIHAVQKNDYQVGLFGHFGSGENGPALRRALLAYLEEQKRNGSTYFTYWAIFEPQDLSEEEHESALWRELSGLTSEEEKSSDWQDGKSTEPSDEEFRFSLNGSELFVVGLHSRSSRAARRFYAPAMVFNVFTQFERLQTLGHYEKMVHTIRARERRFDGGVNPMVEQHGEKWETIQFSGKNNPASWKCPFRFLQKAWKA